MASVMLVSVTAHFDAQAVQIRLINLGFVVTVVKDAATAHDCMCLSRYDALATDFEPLIERVKAEQRCSRTFAIGAKFQGDLGADAVAKSIECLLNKA